MNWIPIFRYRAFDGWVIMFRCGHRRYVLDSMLIGQPELHCFPCGWPREVTRCLEIPANLSL